MELVSEVGCVESHFSPFETVLVSMQDGSTIGTKHNIGREIILAHSLELVRDVAQVKARFGPFGDHATLDAIVVHGLHRTYRRLGIELEAPNGTPRSRGSCGISFRSVLRWC
jgi:hypothetical protein